MLVVFCVVYSMLMTLSDSYDNIPVIIWWSNDLYPHLNPNNLIKCSSSVCNSSHKKLPPKRENVSVAILFYGTDFNPENLPLPRWPNHIWALIHEESPMNNYLFSHAAGITLFNYTSTFSRYSDYPLTTQFIPSIEYLIERKPVPISKKNELRKAGFAPILYVQSHCNIASDRDRYVKELMNYITVDSYGTCVHNKDLPAELNSTEMYDSEYFLNFISQYKFHIAFENALCDDYITEKLFRPLHVGSIPIYKGSSSIRDWGPSKNSIIMADDFENPKELAAFIKTLDENDDLYNSFLHFKQNVSNDFLKKTLSSREWGINDPEKNDFMKGFECFICDSITNNIAGNPKIASRSHMNCQQPRPSRGDILPSTDKWMKEEWIENYWFALDQAKAVRKMIDSEEHDSSRFLSYLMQMKYNH